jgi:hypothetical protein
MVREWFEKWFENKSEINVAKQLEMLEEGFGHGQRIV